MQEAASNTTDWAGWSTAGSAVGACIDRHCQESLNMASQGWSRQAA